MIDTGASRLAVLPPSINRSYDRARSAGTDPGFKTRLLISPNGEHGVVDNAGALRAMLSVMGTANAWPKHGFFNGAGPSDTPTVYRAISGDRLFFGVPGGDTPITSVELNFATQIDTTSQSAYDFSRVRLLRLGGAYYGSIPIGRADGRPAGHRGERHLLRVGERLGGLHRQLEDGQGRDGALLHAGRHAGARAFPARDAAGAAPARPLLRTVGEARPGPRVPRPLSAETARGEAARGHVGISLEDR